MSTISAQYAANGHQTEKNSEDENKDELDLYKYIDRYGFVHKEPPKIETNPKEQKRTKKWVKMINTWKSTNYAITPLKLEKRIQKGIPDSVRGEIWRRLLGIPTVLIEQEGKYEEMLKFGLEHSKDIRQIDLDVNRTYRNHIMFRDRFSTKQCMLYRILVAYSVYNSEIGYCQGMSHIAALILMYMDEEDAFWSLSTLMSSDKHAMHGFFIPGFPKLRRFSAHHDRIVKKLLPKVYKRFKEFGIDSTLYTLKWFFQCFLDKVPFPLTLRLWDCFIYYGEIILTSMSYTLLRLHKKTILKRNLEDTITFLQVDLEQDFGYEDDEVIIALFKSIVELRRYKLDKADGDPALSELPSKPFGMLLTDNHHDADDQKSQSAVGGSEEEAEHLSVGQTTDKSASENGDENANEKDSLGASESSRKCESNEQEEETHE